MSSTTYQSPYKPTPTSTQLDTFVRWLRLRKYRIEVTYGVYVFTPMEKLAFWTLFSFFFVVISTALILYTHRFLLRAVASLVDSRSSSLASHLLTAKQRAMTGLTTSAAAAQGHGIEKAMDVVSGAAKNSQVA
ncbi:hypothetical protein F4859DRAFT_261182 [Xylaria cf. heliscus]|nr:hypothetical protein F4859DRAFT_261182 [Xylaria cf. heliscus]